MRTRELVSVALVLSWVIPAAAQPVQGISISVPLVTAPLSTTPVICQGGSSAAVTSVGTTATEVCAPATTTRTWWRVTNLNPVGGNSIYCTDDGSTVTLSHWSVVVYAGGYTTSESNFVSSAVISCISPGASVITANAVQTGTP